MGEKRRSVEENVLTDFRPINKFTLLSVWSSTPSPLNGQMPIKNSKIFCRWSLICLNSCFQKRLGKRWTHTHPNGTKSQIDFLFVNKKWINSCMNCEAYSSFCGVSSDHRIVSCNLTLSLRKNKTKKITKTPYDWSQLAKNQHVKDAYTLELHNRFNALQESEENPSPNSTYDNFIQSHHFAAEKCIPLRPKAKRQAPWENNAVKEKKRYYKQQCTPLVNVNVQKKKLWRT